VTNVRNMDTSTTWLVCKPAPLLWAVFPLLLAANFAAAAVAQDSAFGTLVVQSPVQAVATLNGEGAFLLVPGQDLRWSRIRPGNYRVDVRSGGEQWQREVQVQPGRTETLVAALSSAGHLLEAGVAPPPPVTGSTPAPAYVPPPPVVPMVSAPSVTQQRKEERAEQALSRRQQQDLLRQQREAEARARREEQRQEQERLDAEAQNQPKRRRPKVH